MSAKAKNALFNRVVNCSTTKEVWDTLEATHEGTNQVKMAKIQMLVSKLESSRMLEEKTIGEFYTKITEIVSSLLGLGEKIDESKVVRKILRLFQKDSIPRL